MPRRGRPPHPDVLTPAEWSVLDGVREGATNAEIADRLGISVNTVRYHVSNMLTKLHAADRQALAAWRGAPASEVRLTGGGLFALARFLGLAAGLVVVAALVWLALDRLSGVTSEAPAGADIEVSATPSEATPTRAVDPQATVVPFVTDGQLWARAFRTTSTDTRPPRTAVLPDGSLIVAWTLGTFEADPGMYQADLGTGPIPNAGGTDVAIGRIAPDGTALWSRVFGSPDSDSPDGLVVTGDAIYLSGAYQDGFEMLGPQASRGSSDGFLARLDLDGNPEWVRTFGGDGRDRGGELALFPDGDIAMSGSFEESADFFGTLVTDEEERVEFDYPGVIARLSPDGTPRWVRVAEGDALAVHPETSEVIYSYSAGPQLPADAPDSDWSGIGALSPDGEPTWQYPFHGGGRTAVYTLGMSPDGSIVGVGAHASPTDFGEGEVIPNGWVSGDGNPNSGVDSFAISLDADGTLGWVRTWGAWPLDRARGLAFDGDEVLVAGSFVLVLEIDEFGRYQLPWPEPCPCGNPRGGYVLRFTSEGEAIGLSYLEGGDFERIGSIFAGPPATEDGELIVGGRFRDRVDFPFGSLLSSEWLDYFLARIEAP